MRGTWLGARQLSRSCVFHLDNYLGPSRVSHVDYVVQKNARGNVNGATTLAMQKLNAITVSIYLYIYVCVWDIGKKTFTVINYNRGKKPYLTVCTFQKKRKTERSRDRAARPLLLG